jgi:hypothetical protein
MSADPSTPNAPHAAQDGPGGTLGSWAALGEGETASWPQEASESVSGVRLFDADLKTLRVYSAEQVDRLVAGLSERIRLLEVER